MNDNSYDNLHKNYDTSVCNLMDASFLKIWLSFICRFIYENMIKKMY